jgi:hypothetical protein
MIDVQLDFEFRRRCRSDANLETFRQWKASSNLNTKIVRNLNYYHHLQKNIFYNERVVAYYLNGSTFSEVRTTQTHSQIARSHL